MTEEKSFLDELTRQKPESFQEERFIPVKKNRAGLLFCLALASAAALIVFFILNRSIAVPDMTGWSLNDITLWVKQNHANTTMKGVYSIDTAADAFISSQPDASTGLKKNDALAITYSLGPDPEELIVLEDFNAMTVQEVQAFIDSNKLTGVSLRYEYSEIIPKDSVISFELLDGSSERFLRKNRMNIYISKGAQQGDQTFKMPDFIGRTKSEAMLWSLENQASVELQEEFSDYFDYGVIYRQSIKKDTKITRSEKVVLYLSRGKPREVPDFTGMQKNQITELALLQGLSVGFVYQSDKGASETALRQDTEPGTQVDVSQKIIITLSKNPDTYTLPDFSGLSVRLAENLAALQEIKVFVKTEDGEAVSGTEKVLKQTPEPGALVSRNTLVTLVVSDMKEGLVPEFKGLTRSQATALAKNLSLEVVFNEVSTTVAPNNTVTGQSMAAGSPIEAQQALLLDIAVNSGIEVKDLSPLSREEALAWASEKGAVLTLVDTYSDTQKAGTLYGQTQTTGYLPQSGRLTLYHSLGPVSVSDFTGKTKPEIIAWQKEVNSKGASVALNFKEDPDSGKAYGTILSQSHKNDLVKLNAAIDVFVSSNTKDGVKVPDFQGVSEVEFRAWCAANSVTYIIRDSYSDIYALGTLYNQNYVNTYIKQGETLRITRSLGPLQAESFTGRSKEEVLAWQVRVNTYGAEIKLDFNEMHSDTSAQGTVMSQSHYGTLTIGTTLTVTLSLGPE